MSNQRLIEQAWNLLDTGEIEAARKTGLKLVEAKEKAGYTIVAATWEAEENWETAIQILKDGVEILKDSWELWFSLGNMYSNNEEYENAMTAFDHALMCSEVESDWITLNKAVVNIRMLEFDAALNMLQSLADSLLKNQAFLLKIQLLDQLNRSDLILSLTEEELEDLEVPQDENSAKEMGEICAIIAGACWTEDEDPEVINHYLSQAKAYDRRNLNSLYLIREMEPDFSDEGKMYELIVQGKMKVSDSEVKTIDFFTSYQVFSDSEEEALNYIKNFEIEDIDTESLQIIEIGLIEEDDDIDIKGIYAVSGFTLLDTENGA